jgi:4-hydroxybenzoate polyprenyltransferase
VWLNTKTIQEYVNFTRPANALAVLLGYSAGYFLTPVRLHPAYFISLVILLLLHSAATVQNDIEDIEIDKANRRSSILINNTANKKQAEYLAWALLFAALGLALLSPQRKINLLFIALFFTFSWLYSRPPFSFSRRPVLSILTMGLCYGALPLIYGYAVSAGRSNYAVWFAVTWFGLRVSTSILKDFKDAPGDKLHGKRTFYLVFGRKATALVSIFMSSCFYLLAIILVITKFGIRPPVIILAIVVSIAALRNVMTRLRMLGTQSEKTLAAIFGRSFYQQNQFDALILLCLIVL